MAKYDRKKPAVAELVACLMKAPRTKSDILGMIDMSEPTLRAWLIVLHEAGVIRKKGLRMPPPGTSGAGSMEYEWQRYPFELEDMEP